MSNFLRLAFTLCLILGALHWASAQKTIPLREKTSTTEIQLVGEPDHYLAKLTLQGHDLQVGDAIDGVDAAGHRVSFKVTKTAVANAAVAVLKTGQSGSLDLTVTRGKMADFAGEFYLVDAGAPYPTPMAIASAEGQPVFTITAQLGGLPWKATLGAEGAIYSPKATEHGGKPYLLLSFASANAPDNRTLMIEVVDFVPKAGSVAKENCTIILSGSADGEEDHAQTQEYMDKGAYKKYVFTFKVTRWERVSGEKAILSATFSGKLKGALDFPDIVVNNGSIEGLEVRILGGK